MRKHNFRQVNEISLIWLTLIILSASGMMMEIIAYRQWRVFLGRDALYLVLPMVMVGLAAGAIIFYQVNRKLNIAGNHRVFTRPDFIFRPLVAYAALSFFPFLLLQFSITATPGLALLFSGGSTFILFLLFGIWGYVNADLYDRGHKKIFSLYMANLLGTIFGVCIAITVMDMYGTARAISSCISAAILTAWVWLILKKEVRRKVKFIISIIALSSMIVCFALPPSSFIFFKGKEPPVWFDSNSFSQLEMYPIKPLDILRAPGLKAISAGEYNVQAWRVNFDRLDFNYTNIVRYNTLEEVMFLKEELSSLAFLLGNHDRALILGAGGGIEVIQGLLAGFREIDAVEINPLVIKAIEHVSATDFMNAAGVKYHIADARRFLLQDIPKYDLIFMPHVRGQEVGGVISTRYMNTAELIHRFLDNINTDGSLVIRNHRRDWPSLLATIQDVLNNRTKSEEWSAFLASETMKRKAYNLVILRRGHLSPNQNSRVSSFIKENGFNWAQIDLNTAEDNKFVLTDDHPYAVNLENILLPVSRSLRDGRFIFQRPVPLFFQMLFPFCIAIVFIFSLCTLQRRSSQIAGARQLIISGNVYLISLGSGFLAAEIVLIEKTFSVTGNPTLSLGITISSLLGGALLTNYLLRNIDSRRLAAFVPKLTFLVAFALGLTFLTLEKLAVILYIPDWSRIALAACAIFIPGAFMGALFPSTLRLLAEAEQDSIPWSWAVNGIAAILGGIAAKFLAITFGYHMVLAFVTICYIFAAVASQQMTNRLSLFRKD